MYSYVSVNLINLYLSGLPPITPPECTLHHLPCRGRWPWWGAPRLPRPPRPSRRAPQGSNTNFATTSCPQSYPLANTVMLKVSFVISYSTLGIQSEVQFKQRFKGSTLMIVFLSPCVRGSATSSLVDPVHSWISSLPCTRLNPLR